MIINKCVTAVKVLNFSGHYLRNRSTLDIGVLGYIGIVQHKEHSPEVLSIPPVTPCIVNRSKNHIKFLVIAYRADILYQISLKSVKSSATLNFQMSFDTEACIASSSRFNLNSRLLPTAVGNRSQVLKAVDCIIDSIEPALHISNADCSRHNVMQFIRGHLSSERRPVSLCAL